VIYNFEGIAFNDLGKPLPKTALQLRIWIRNKHVAGEIMYEEIQTVLTSDKGVFLAHIGIGKVLSGSMSALASENKSRYMKVEMASVGETDIKGPIRFQCLKCRRCTDRYLPERVGDGS
jgi:hypothetical protein